MSPTELGYEVPKERAVFSTGGQVLQNEKSAYCNTDLSTTSSLVYCCHFLFLIANTDARASISP